MNRITRVNLIALSAGLAAAVATQAQDAAFTYQGVLKGQDSTHSGVYQMRFSLHGAESGGTAVAGPLTNAVAVANNLFAVTLNFGAAVFDGGRRWLEIGVATNGADSFTTLAPRQEILATPYAIAAAQLTGPLPSNGLSGVYGQPVSFSNPANSFAGDGSGLTNVRAATLGGLSRADLWQLGGNLGSGAGSFLGTLDEQALELKVKGERALRLEPTADVPNVIGGFRGNYVSGAATGVTIAGGGGTGQTNRIEDYHYDDERRVYHLVPNSGTIGGGTANWIASGTNATIAGGASNSITGGRFNSPDFGGDNNTIGGGANNVMLNSQGSTIAGGVGNNVTGNPIFGVVYSTIGGGAGNEIEAHSDPVYFATIAGGASNYIGRNSSGAIGGGVDNLICQNAASSTIAGGGGNSICGPDPKYSTIGGGSDNSASRQFATIPGGSRGSASLYGQLAYASGAFADRGDAQTSVYVCRGLSTNDAEIELFLDGQQERMHVRSGSTWAFDVLITGRAANGDSAAYQIRGAIKNNAETTTMMGLPVKTVLGEDVADWDANAYAGDVNNVLLVDVIGAPNTTIRWVASVRTVEVIH